MEMRILWYKENFLWQQERLRHEEENYLQVEKGAMGEMLVGKL